MLPADHTIPDLSRYVAVGDSITAGYADGALYYEGQQHAYANILAAQIELAGGGAFRQPFLPIGSPGIDLLGHSRLTLVRRPGEPDVLDLAYLAPEGDSAALQKNNYTSEGPYTNMGVPGAKAITTVFPGFGNPANGPGNYNPFFTRMASDVAKASILSDALLDRPTFFTVFIGNNDALAYALAGCTENALTPPKGAAGLGFEGSLHTIVNTLSAGGARGVIANLPSIAHIPYFKAIPYNGLWLEAGEAALLNEHYRGAGLHFVAGTNAFVVADASDAQGYRQAQAGEFILMDVLLDANKTGYLKGQAPIPKRYTLTPGEVLSIEQTIEAYNVIIRSVAEEKKLGFVDVNHLLKLARPDRQYNPRTLSLDYAKKGVFSLDGLHPNSFGQALLANEFIKAINQSFGTSLQTVRSYRYLKA